MSRPQHPTAPVTELYDPLLHPAPRGVKLVLINEGGVLAVGPWYEGALAWGFPPKIPATVKARMSAQLQRLMESGNGALIAAQVDADVAADLAKK